MAVLSASLSVPRPDGMHTPDQRVQQGTVRGRGDHLDIQIADHGKVRRDPGQLRNIGVRPVRPVVHSGDRGGDKTMQVNMSASVASALMQPATWRRPVASTTENSAQMRRPRARRLSNFSCDRIAAIRETATSSRRVRLIWDSAMVGAKYRSKTALFSQIRHGMVGLGLG